MKNTYALVFALAGISVGCSSTPSRLDAQFGETVTHVLSEQTHNPAASREPRPVTVLDGEKAMGTLEGYRAAPAQEGVQPVNVVPMKIKD
jgi:hypothetical protein